MAMTKAARAEQAEAIAKLREWLKPGDTVYTVLRNVSRSGMQREIGIVIMKDGTDLHPNYLVGKALNERIGKRDGIIVGGCGMDMGFHLVYNLGRTLFPDGFEVKPDHPKVAHGKCPKCGHYGDDCTGSNTPRGRNGDTSGHDNDGGYALKQRWL